MDTSDAELVQAVIGGSEEAFGTLVGRYSRQVRAACRRQVPESEVDDCVQAVFMLLFRRTGAAARAPVLLAWLLRVAHFVCRDALRQHRRRRSLMAAVAVPVSEGRAPDAVVLERLDTALQGLDERQRSAVSLHILAGEDPAAVAVRMGITRDNAYKLIQRGLAALRDRMTRLGAPIGVSALMALVSSSLEAAAEPSACVPITTHRPTPHAERLARNAWKDMTMPHLLTWIAAACLLLGLGLAIVSAAEPPPVPKASPPAAAGTIDAVLAQRPHLVVSAFGLGQAMQSIAMAIPASMAFEASYPRLDKPGRWYRSIDLVLGPDQTVREALDRMAQQTGCRWSVTGGRIVFELTDDPPVPGDPATWDAAAIAAAMDHGQLDVVRTGILRWLERPDRRGAQQSSWWLGWAILAGDPELAGRCAAAGMRPHARPERRSVQQLRAIMAEPGVQRSLLSHAAKDLLTYEDAGDAQLFADLLQRKDVADATRQVLAARCGLAGRRHILRDGPAGMVRELNWGFSYAKVSPLVGRGADPVWQAELAALLQRPGEDPERQAAEVVMSRSPSPSTWNALVAAWRSSTGPDRTRLSGVILAAGARGAAAYEEALASGTVASGEFAAALRLSGEPTTALVDMCLRIVGDDAQAAEYRLAVLERLIFGFCAQTDPRVIDMGMALASREGLDPTLRAAAIRQVGILTRRADDARFTGLFDRLAHDAKQDPRVRAEAIEQLIVRAWPGVPGLGQTLIDEARSGGPHADRWQGLGLKALHVTGRLHADDGLVRAGLGSPSPYVRAIAHYIVASDLRGGKESAPMIRFQRIPGAAQALVAELAPLEAVAASNVSRADGYLDVARDDPNPHVRMRAAHVAMQLLPPERRVAALEELIKSESDPEVRGTYGHTFQVGTFDESGRTPSVGKRYQFLDVGPGFPTWLPGRDGVVPVANDAIKATN